MVGNCSYPIKLQNFSNTEKSAFFFYDTDSRKVRCDMYCIGIRNWSPGFTWCINTYILHRKRYRLVSGYWLKYITFFGRFCQEWGNKLPSLLCFVSNIKACKVNVIMLESTLSKLGVAIFFQKGGPMKMKFFFISLSQL